MLKTIKKYFLPALIAASVYCITVVIFLSSEKYQSIWVLFLGNALFLFSIAAIVYLSNKSKANVQAMTSAISGTVLSITGAAISVILSILLYLAFSAFNKGEKLHEAPAAMSVHPVFNILFVLVVIAALGNTISGFFAALFTSFDSAKSKAA